MTALSAPAPATLADWAVRRAVLTNALLVVGGAAFTGILAQVSVPLWPVPITGQTLAVLLVGTSLGAARGSLSLAVYALLGMAGVPWFSDQTGGWGVIVGPTGGYILGFIAAAALTGWLAERRWDRRWFGALVSLSAGTVVVFAFGLPWLAFSLGLNLEQTLQAGLFPFLIGGAIKAVIAAGLIRGAWTLADRRASS
ncbi:biotin transporter BioY [Microcella sp.]|uniref:biotin transporter BioY n=1 Tax=Microcella sp. TaxID=1913979 RepID=UPI002561FAE9|nr:biotin transporter BioY [Microcella sp.]MBX9472384.1 biotin transporter BioY [Microcella sp.]